LLDLLLGIDAREEFNDMKGQLAKSQYVPFISDYEKAEEEKRQLRKNPILKNKVL